MSILTKIIKLPVRWMNENKEDIVCMSKFTFSACLITLIVYLALMSINFWIMKIL